MFISIRVKRISVNETNIKVEKSYFQTLLIVNFIYELYLYINISMINLITFDHFYFKILMFSLIKNFHTLSFKLIIVLIFI